MIRVAVFILSILFACNHSYVSIAQTGNSNTYDFIPGEKVIFEDDFHTDKISAFPSLWQVSACTDPQEYYAKRSWTIQKGDENYVLRSATTFLHISPVIQPQSYPKDSFTIEFDCTYEDPAACAELYFSPAIQTAPCKEVSFHILSWGKINVFYPGGEIKYTADYPGDFDYKTWHHFALSYCNKEIKCYLDGYAVLKIPDCDFSPQRISLGCIAPVKYSRFNIALITKNGSVEDILTKRKFVTHAIHFDPGKSIIKPESMGIIGALVNFLQMNPTINLQIDGHTDGDGSRDNNMLLSDARAAEVKRLLVDRGISEQRLTTKGYGASKPLKPNTNPMNKAENRRVEFIRQ